MSLVIATFGDGLQRELPSCLSLLVDRMSYEITRLTAVKVSNQLHLQNKTNRDIMVNVELNFSILVNGRQKQMKMF